MKCDKKFDNTHQKILDTALDTICKAYPDVIAVYVFGSFATAFENRESDVDLAFLRAKESNNVETWELAQEIARMIDRDVELIDMQKASTVFRYQIFASGTCIFCQNDVELARFENLAISMYLRFQEERKEILKSYLGEDKKYG